MELERKILVNADDLAEMLGISLRSVRTMDAQETIPAAVQIGRQKRWRRAEILAWLDSGCPERSAWKTLRPVGGLTVLPAAMSL